MAETLSKFGFPAALLGGLLSLALPLEAHADAMTKQASATQATKRVNVRGAIESVTDKAIIVKTREGPEATVALSDGWVVGGVAKASIDDIKKGDFVGITNVPKSEGVASAVEVVIFPAALKGTGEGDRPWDLKPNSSMTNATVADAVKDVDGRTLTVVYHGTEKKIASPDGTPIVTLAKAGKDDLKPGATVFISAERGSGDSLSTKRIVVGTNGVVPPM
ncbi:MAG: hypothetical protein AAAB35_16190 [Phyllobacterium sp.]|uniref:hypothetical protein n=1 Tax=Phyllobacterium sp. TaxID=1871046 RepID=UPI0030F262F8